MLDGTSRIGLAAGWVLSSPADRPGFPSPRSAPASPSGTRDQVAEAARIVRASGLLSETNAMFTNVEGEWDEVMPVIRACIGKVAEAAPRVTVVIRLDRRPGEPAGRLSVTWSRWHAGCAEAGTCPART